jgi:C-terminal processing protease CtpA/Prc
MKFGAYTVEKPYGTLSGDADGHTLIGSRIIENFTVTLDQKNSRVRFAREDTSPIVLPPYRLVGFRLQREEEGFVVWGVMTGSPAERAGIKNGDVVTIINGKPVAEVYGLPAWDQLLQDDTLEIRYKPAGESNHRRVELEVWELLP